MSVRNKLSDLNNILFEQLERLNDIDLDGDKNNDPADESKLLTKEITRAKAIQGIGKSIIDNAKTMLDGARFQYKYGSKGGAQVPKLFTSENAENNK